MTDNKNDLVNALGSKSLAGNFYLGISELFFELEIDGQEFVDDFISSFLTETSNRVKTKGEVQIKTGFTKYQISEYFKGNLKRSTNAEKNLYNLMIERIKFNTQNKPDHIIPIKRHKDSFNSIFNSLKTGSMLTAKMMLESLLNRGFLEKIDNNHVKFISSTPTRFINTPEKILQLFCDLTFRASKTLIHNLHAVKGTEKFQRSIMSDRVPPDKYELVEKGVKAILDKAHQECTALIDQHEVKDEINIKKVEKLGQELGFTTFYFNNKA